MGLGLSHVKLIINSVVNLVEGVEYQKELIEVNLFLGLAEFAKCLVNGFFIKHFTSFRFVGLDIGGVEYGGAISKCHKLPKRHSISLMGDHIKGGIRATGIKLLFTVEFEDNPCLLLKYLIVFFLRFSVDWG